MSIGTAQHVYMSNSIGTAPHVYVSNQIGTAQHVYVSNQVGTARHVYVSSQGTGIYLTGCFPLSELVNTCPDKYVPIRLLKIGDKIGSWDLEKKKKQYTAITGIHAYMVNDIMCFNNTMQVSASHPLMIVEETEYGALLPKWKVAFEVNIGDYLVGTGGKLIAVKTKRRQWYTAGTEVLNLSTEGGAPFLVRNCVVRAENAQDSIEWAATPVTQKLLAA